ncbi:MAG: hypothetical protein JSS34_01460 [Proteobacteria bacterium]|nr:hypothetical protein [Pseudomonadota bacterium]
MALTAAVRHISKEDMKLAREDMTRREEEVSKRDALWAKFLEKIHNVDKKFYALEKQIYKIKSDWSQKA